MGLMGQPRGTSARIVVDGLEGVVGLLDKVAALEKKVTTLQGQLVDHASVMSTLLAQQKAVEKKPAAPKASPPPPAPKPVAKKAPAKKKAGSKRKR